MRDTKALHPDLQKKITELQALCKKNHISIKIGECLRTKAEQDALYAKGRTAPGPKVTNASGSTYSSMHQWGVAFDFYLDMDIDGDGSKADDAFNDATHLFEKVGSLGQSIGLEWGGSWTSIKDLPHFQLPNWGSTPTKLKQQYGTPEKFIASWKGGTTTAAATTAKSSATPASKSSPVAAKSKSAKYNKSFTTNCNANMRLAPVNGGVILTAKKGTKVMCYGYYTKATDGYEWLFVQNGKYTGYIRKDLLK